MTKREVEENLIPVCRWIRGYYPKLTKSNEAVCNQYNHKYISLYIIYAKRTNTLHKHLVEAHPDKLTKEGKKEVEFYWDYSTWEDFYFTIKGD